MKSAFECAARRRQKKNKKTHHDKSLTYNQVHLGHEASLYKKLRDTYFPFYNISIYSIKKKSRVNVKLYNFILAIKANLSHYFKNPEYILIFILKKKVKK